MRDGWERLQLGDFAELSVDRVKVSDEDTYPMAGVLNEGQGLFWRDELSGLDTSYKHLHRLHSGRLVMRKLTAFEGSIAVVEPTFDGAFVSTEFPTFEMDASRVYPDFMRMVCQMSSFWHEMWLRSTGTVQRRKRVNPAALLSIYIDVPPMREQRRIVDLVCSFGEVSAAANDEATRIRRAMWAIGEHLVFDGAFPEESVEAIADERGVVGGPFGSSLGRKDYVSSGVPVIRGQNMSQTEGGMVGGEFAFVSDEKADQLAGNLALPGDVVFTQRGTLGQTALVPQEPHPRYVVSQSQMRLRPDPERVCSEYIYEVFCTPRMVRSVQAMNTATANPHISLGILRGITIPVPDLTTQGEIVSVLSTFRTALEAARALADAAAAAEAHMRTALLSGTVGIAESFDDLLVEVS